MIEDELLKWRFKRGSKDALQRIYEKYLNYLLTLAMALLHNVSDAEDVVHDIFIHFAESADRFKAQGNLKSYLATCVVNRVRDRIRTRQRQTLQKNTTIPTGSDMSGPEQSIIASEEAQQLNDAMAQVPELQREVIVLRLKGQMKFKDIARLQGVSINTIQGRYRYGLDKMRSILNGQVEK